MPAKEIKELRHAGKLDEAFQMASEELNAEPENIWAKRNLSWVLYDYVKENSASADRFSECIKWLVEVQSLDLPAEEAMFYENLTWQIGKMAFALSNTSHVQVNKVIQLLNIVKSLPLPDSGEPYVFLFKAFHKGLKDSSEYIGFADWWDFKNFRPEDYEKERLDNGREIMAIAEQAYIAYAKHLLPKIAFDGGIQFDEEKTRSFLPSLERIVESYPKFQYPAYFYAKLLLALGKKEDSLSALLPFARKKRNDFWVWQVLADAYSEDKEKQFAFYCKALSCRSPEEMLIKLREEMAALLIEKGLFDEAKTEIELLTAARAEKGYRIPWRVTEWQNAEWYAKAESNKSNNHFYQQYLPEAEAVLFSDIPQETIFVDFVNNPKKILNFMSEDGKVGFFKYDRFFRNVKIGDVLQVRFQASSSQGMYQVLTAEKADDPGFAGQFMRTVTGHIAIKGKPFGFLNDAFVSPAVVSRYKLEDGMEISATVIKSYNREKKQWGWKVVEAAEVIGTM